MRVGVGQHLLRLLQLLVRCTMRATEVVTCAQVSAIISSACYSSWFLLAGFVIPRPVSPHWPLPALHQMMRRSQLGRSSPHTVACMQSLETMHHDSASPCKAHAVIQHGIIGRRLH